MESLLSGFNEYRMLILKELERNDERLMSLESTLNDIQKDIAILQLKSGIWGAFMGALTAFGAYFIGR